MIGQASVLHGWLWVLFALIFILLFCHLSHWPDDPGDDLMCGAKVSAGACEAGWNRLERGWNGLASVAVRACEEAEALWEVWQLGSASAGLVCRAHEWAASQLHLCQSGPALECQAFAGWRDPGRLVPAACSNPPSAPGWAVSRKTDFLNPQKRFHFLQSLKRCEFVGRSGDLAYCKPDITKFLVRGRLQPGQPGQKVYCQGKRLCQRIL